MRLSSGNRLFVLKPELSSYKEVKKRDVRILDGPLYDICTQLSTCLPEKNNKNKRKKKKRD